MTEYEARIADIVAELGISPDYFDQRRLALQVEATELVSIGLDIFGRERRLTPAAAAAWTAMQSAAAAEGVTVLLVSAFRSVMDQRRILVRKINEGVTLEEILAVNAPPGYSEHHTGRAIDVATPGTRPLVEEFDTTAAFEWLRGNAARFGFVMPYPRGNPYGFVYEPWHWTYATI
jgi:D-alanyl-D-alanine carboxypeptidase